MVRVAMFGGYGQNSNFWKDRLRILMFGRIRSEFQCLKKRTVRIPMSGRITLEFQFVRE